MSDHLVDDEAFDVLAAPETGDAQVQIVLCPDGPLLVRGRPVILNADGTEVSGGRGTVALCRCGGSAIKPFCDGTHKVNGFRSQD